MLEQAWHEGHARARLAIKTFIHRIARHIAGHAAALAASRRHYFHRRDWRGTRC
ncbi:hypothetical protein LNP17_19355 [Klebsiella variicola subsp. variicola]|nr:hypothetical protein [Klebsiella variicola subsp. variicola]